MSKVIKVHEDKIKSLQESIKQEQLDIINIKKILKDKVKNVNVYDGAVQMAQQTINLLKQEEEQQIKEDSDKKSESE
jgi:hypothetical protein